MEVVRCVSAPKERENVDEVLINKVRKYRVLYDPGNVDYRNQNVRQMAWEEIASNLGNITATAAKERWECLRRCYCNARQRRSLKHCGQLNKSQKPWRYEHLMDFLVPYMEGRMSTTNLVKWEVNTPSTSPNNLENNYQSDEVNEDDTENEKIVIDEDILKQARGLSDNTPSTSSYKHNDESKRNVTSREEPFEIQKISNLDVTDMFFLSMARMTKKLPLAAQTRIKMGLSSLVFEEELLHNTSEGS